MDRYIFTLKYSGRMDVPDEKDNRDEAVVEELQDLLLKDEIEYLGWNKDGGLALDTAEEYFDDPLLADETLFEIRMPVDVDIHDLQEDVSGRPVLQYISSSLDFRPYHVSVCYDMESGDFVKTFIEITVSSNAEL